MCNLYDNHFPVYSSVRKESFKRKTVRQKFDYYSKLMKMLLLMFCVSMYNKMQHKQISVYHPKSCMGERRATN